MGIGNQSIRSKPIIATVHKIYFLTSPGTPATEFAQALTNGTKQLMIRSENTGIIQFTFITGESGTKYITIPKNSNYKASNLDLQSFTLYMQVDKASEAIQIEEWS